MSSFKKETGDENPDLSSCIGINAIRRRLRRKRMANTPGWSPSSAARGTSTSVSLSHDRSYSQQLTEVTSSQVQSVFDSPFILDQQDSETSFPIFSPNEPVRRESVRRGSAVRMRTTSNRPSNALTAHTPQIAKTVHVNKPPASEHWLSSLDRGNLPAMMLQTDAVSSTKAMADSFLSVSELKESDFLLSSFSSWSSDSDGGKRVETQPTVKLSPVWRRTSPLPKQKKPPSTKVIPKSDADVVKTTNPPSITERLAKLMREMRSKRAQTKVTSTGTINDKPASPSIVSALRNIKEGHRSRSKTYSRQHPDL